MHSINKQLYLVSQCIKLETSLPPDYIMECLIQTVVYLSAYIYMNTQYAQNVKINENACWDFFIVLVHTGYKGLYLCRSTRMTFHEGSSIIKKSCWSQFNSLLVKVLEAERKSSAQESKFL